MKKTILLFVGLFTFFHVYTQSIEDEVAWAKTLRISGDEIYVETDPDNNVVIAAYYRSCPYCYIDWGGDTLYAQGGNVHDIFLAKLDPDGNMLWHQLIAGFGDKRIYGFKVDQQNNIILYIYAYQPFDYSFANIKQGYNLIKIDETGQLLWSKHISGITFPYLLTSELMDVDMDNEIILGGEIRKLWDPNTIIDSIVLGNETFYIYRTYYDTLRVDAHEITVDTNNFFIAKFYPTGDLGWVKTFEHTGAVTMAAIATSIDNKINIIGNFQSESWLINGQELAIDTFGDKYKHNAFLLQLEETGQINWVKRYFDDLYADNITTDPSGNVIGLGHIFNDTYFEQDTVYYNTPNPDFVVFKVDPLGNYEWATNESDKNSGSSPYFIKANSHNDIYFSGDVSPNTGPIMVKYSKDGDLLWILDPPHVGNRSGRDIDFDQCGNLIQVGGYSGNYIIGSDTLIWSLILGVGHKYIVKYKNQSEPSPGFNCGVSDVAFDYKLDNQMVIYPNPTANLLNIKMNLPVEGDLTLTLIDLFGRIVHAKKVRLTDLGEYQLDVSDIPSGSYNVRIVAKNYCLTRKILVIK